MDDFKIEIQNVVLDDKVKNSIQKQLQEMDFSIKIGSLDTSGMSSSLSWLKKRLDSTLFDPMNTQLQTAFSSKNVGRAKMSALSLNMPTI